MRSFVTIIGILSGMACTGWVAAQQAPDSGEPQSADERPSTAADILRAARHRNAGDRMRAQLFIRIERSGEEPEVRRVHAESMQFADGHRTMYWVEGPDSMRNTALLNVVRRGSEDDDEQWLFDPRARETRRMEGETRASSFLGSDLSYADLILPEPESYEFRLEEHAVTMQGESTWHIVAVPKRLEIARETGYRKMELWIGRRSFLPLQVLAYELSTGRVKTITVADVEEVDGIFTPTRIVARTERRGELESETVIEQVSVRFGDPSVRVSDLTPGRLSRGI